MQPLGSSLEPRDGLLHQPAFHEPAWLETHWFSFLVPERNLRGHVYSTFRTNVGVVFSHVLVWSRDCASQLDFDYYDSRIHLPMPEGNLDGYRLGNGLQVTMQEPLMRYHIDYEGFNGMRLDLDLEGMMPAIESRETKLPTGGQDFSHFHPEIKPMVRGDVGHIDQTFMVRGEMVLNGETIEIAYPGNHDHSWSPRPEHGHGRGYFDEGYFGKEGQDLTFHVQTKNDRPDVGTVTNGYIIDHGELLGLKAGEARYEMDGWHTKKLEYELEDTRGRTHRFVGTPTAATIFPTFPNQFQIIAVTKWTHDGEEEGWGEYKWHWEVSKMLGLSEQPAGAEA
jgi:hypothetical protein